MLIGEKFVPSAHDLIAAGLVAPQPWMIKDDQNLTKMV